MTAALAHIVRNLGRPKVLVLGDLILDRYIWGDAERISQEAPVILLRADHNEERLGGAASVSSMLAALGAEVTLAGVLGNDEDSRRVRKLLDEYRIAHQFVLADPARPTTVKERFIGRAQQKHPQQMMRVDYEVRSEISANLVDRLSAAIRSIMAQTDIVLVSDYDKGVCAPAFVQSVIAEAKKCGKRVLVDPIRGGNYRSRYCGCSAMTPNRLEAGLAAGISIASVESAFEAAEKMMQQLDMEVGLVTLDRDGMALVDRQTRRKHFSVRPRQVYDITGAGDMVLAVLGMVLAAGHNYDDAITIANVAGGLEVERIGVATLTREEIIRDLTHGTRGTRNKIVSTGTLIRELHRRRQEKESIVFTNGCFDILHAGHVHYLAEAKAQGNVLVLGLNTDASVRRLGKGSERPINDQSSRAAVLAALEFVDYVCLFDEDTPINLIKHVRPDVLVKGADYRPEEVVGRDYVISYGGRLHLAAVVPNASTTQILSRIRAA